MFENLLLKLLRKYLDRFLEDFNSENLRVGVFSGNIVIENVQLKQSMLQMLGLPFQILYSTIGKLSVIIPWKSMSKEPVVIKIEDVSILVKKLEQSDWKFEQKLKYLMIKRFENLQKYGKKLIEQFMQEQQQKESKSFKERLLTRTVDNIELSVSNIHVRFEELDSFSMGVTLDSISAVTCNENWQKEFIDRTSNPNIILNKVVTLNNLNIYHNSQEQYFIQQFVEQPLVIMERFRSLQKQQKNLVISISSDVTMQQNPVTKTDTPYYDINVVLKELYFDLSSQQLLQIIGLVQMFQKYQRNNQYIKNEQLLTLENSEQYREVYIETMKNVYKQEDKAYEELESDGIFNDQIEYAFVYCPIELQQDWVLDAVKQVIHDKKMGQLEYSKKKYWFNVFGKNEDVTEDEVKEINQFVEQSFEQQQQSSVLESIKLRFNILLQKGHFQFVKQVKGTQNAVKLSYENLSFKMSHYWNQYRDLNLNIEFLQVQMIQKNKNNVESLSFLEQVKGKTFIDLNMELHKQKNIAVKMSGINWIYKKQLLDVMSDFIQQPQKLNQSDVNQQVLENLKNYKLNKELVKQSNVQEDKENIKIVLDVGPQNVQIPLSDKMTQDVFIMSLQQISLKNNITTVDDVTKGQFWIKRALKRIPNTIKIQIYGGYNRRPQAEKEVNNRKIGCFDVLNNRKYSLQNPHSVAVVQNDLKK